MTDKIDCRNKQLVRYSQAHAYRYDARSKLTIQVPVLYITMSLAGVSRNPSLRQSSPSFSRIIPPNPKQSLHATTTPKATHKVVDTNKLLILYPISLYFPAPLPVPLLRSRYSFSHSLIKSQRYPTCPFRLY